MKTFDLECPIVNRFSDNDKVIGFHFNRKLTDDELRVLHDVMKAACNGINEGQAELDELEEIGEISKLARTVQ